MIMDIQYRVIVSLSWWLLPAVCATCWYCRLFRVESSMRMLLWFVNHSTRCRLA
jgi:hypothetical protein